MIAYLDTLTVLQAILAFLAIGVCLGILAAHIDRRMRDRRIKRAKMMVSRSNTVRRMASYRRSINRK